MGFSLQTIGLQYTTPSKNAFLTALNVVIVPFIAFHYFKKEDWNKRNRWGNSVSCRSSAAFLKWQSYAEFGRRTYAYLCCRICISDFPDRRICKKYPAAVLNLVQMFTAFVLSTISMFVFGETDFQVTTKGWLSVLYLAVISTTICYLLQTACQKYVEETKAAIILCMESVFGTVFSIIILHEVITPRMVVGCIIILIAVIISNLSESGGEGTGKTCKR